MILNIVFFVISLAALVFASDKFVESAEKIGLSFGISPFIIGLTIVAFGTSLPELAASIASVYSGSSEIVIGSVIGSNITNILLIIGVTAIIGKGIFLEYDIMNKDMPILISSIFLLFFIISDQKVETYEAILLLIFMGIFLWSSLTSDDDDNIVKVKAHWKDYLFLMLGGMTVYFGAIYTIKYLEIISKSIGISPEIIALTVVALGTSLPELVVSVAAAKKGKHSLAVGNVLGSNIFNTCGVVGIPALLGDLVIPEHTVNFSIVFCVVVTVLFAITTISKKINLVEGFLFILFYAFYIINNF